MARLPRLYVPGYSHHIIYMDVMCVGYAGAKTCCSAR